MRVKVEQRGQVTVITMDDGKANAINQEMLSELNAAFEAVKKLL